MKLIKVHQLRKFYNKPYLRFGIGGGISTALSYIIYFLLTMITTFRIAYSIAFIVSIIISYLLNLIFVFGTAHSFKKSGLFLLIYLSQFICCFFTLDFLVELIKVNPLIAPFFVTVIVMPITYLFIKNILKIKQ